MKKAYLTTSFLAILLGIVSHAAAKKGENITYINGTDHVVTIKQPFKMPKEIQPGQAYKSGTVPNKMTIKGHDFQSVFSLKRKVGGKAGHKGSVVAIKNLSDPQALPQYSYIKPHIPLQIKIEQQGLSIHHTGEATAQTSELKINPPVPQEEQPSWKIPGAKLLELEGAALRAYEMDHFGKELPITNNWWEIFDHLDTNS